MAIESLHMGQEEISNGVLTGLRRWPVGRVLALVFTGAVLVAGSVFWTLLELLGVHRLHAEAELTSKTLFDMVKLSFGVVAGSGALVALVVAYRKQRIDEAGAEREATRLHTERFTTAVAQLGDDSPAVRLGAVHALAGLADDAPTRQLRQTCIDVLCAYVRLPYAPDPGYDDQDGHHAYRSLREVRRTVIRLVRDHLQGGAEHSWQGHDFDFTGAVFDGSDFSGTVFSGGVVSFSKASFLGEETSFANAQFSGGKVLFSGARFASGVHFKDTQFTGSTVVFGFAEFTGGTTLFIGTRFTGGWVNFYKARFLGGRVGFADVVFSEGVVSFHGAVFRAPEFVVTEVRGPLPHGLAPPDGGPAQTGGQAPPG